jgi:hypothetical protein
MSVKTPKDKIPGGLADKVKGKRFDPKQLAKGIKVEMEHTNDKSIACEIAKDHLMEDPKYYDHLIEMEKKVETKAKKANRFANIFWKFAQMHIGWVETVTFPDWGFEVNAKIDTGSQNSSLHVENIERLPKNKVRFDVVIDTETGKRKTIEATISRQGRVKSSNGQKQDRIFVTTQLQLGPECHNIELSLADRKDMTYRMLVGRSYLAGRFMVNV